MLEIPELRVAVAADFEVAEMIAAIESDVIAIITESVFQWPGMGLLFIQAITEADFPIMSAYLLLIALIFVVINLIADILYVYVDPRLRVDGTSSST